MRDYPKKDRNRTLETLSKRHLNSVIPPDWVVNEFIQDYGTDFHCEISNDGEIIGDNFTIQLKSKESDTNRLYVLYKNIKRECTLNSV